MVWGQSWGSAGVHDMMEFPVLLFFCMLVEPLDFVGLAHGFDFVDKSVSISSVAVLFLLEIIRKD